jgi:hypothetical protein
MATSAWPTLVLEGFTVKNPHRTIVRRVTVPVVALLAFGLSSDFQLFWTARTQADEASNVTNSASDQLETVGQSETVCDQAYLDNLEKPKLKPGLNRVVYPDSIHWRKTACQGVETRF